MGKRRKAANGSQAYEVGYGKPPLHSRFKAGQSGNPAGRRRGTRNLSTDVRLMLELPVRVKEGERTRYIPTQEAALMKLREKALQGDVRAIERLIELGARFNNDGAGADPSPVLAADDQAILAAYFATKRATTAAPDKVNDNSKTKPKRRK
jgi:hypothetical protein